MSDNILVIDNFVPKILQNQLEEIACRDQHIDYYFRRDPAYPENDENPPIFRQNDPNIVDKKEFIFYHNLLTPTKKSEFYNDFVCIPNKIMKSWDVPMRHTRSRLILSPPLPHTQNMYGVPHPDFNGIDNTGDGGGHKTAIYYISDSDGDTILFDEYYTGKLEHTKKTIYKRISPKKGRLVIFDALRYHANSWSTQKERVLVNMIFERISDPTPS